MSTNLKCNRCGARANRRCKGKLCINCCKEDEFPTCEHVRDKVRNRINERKKTKTRTRTRTPNILYIMHDQHGERYSNFIDLSKEPPVNIRPQDRRLNSVNRTFNINNSVTGRGLSDTESAPIRPGVEGRRKRKRVSQKDSELGSLKNKLRKVQKQLGYTKKELEKLKKKNKNHTKSSGKTALRICTICQESGISLSMECGHKICLDCLVSWSKESDTSGILCTCPFCRREVKKNTIKVSN